MGLKTYCDGCGKEITPWGQEDYSMHNIHTIYVQKSSNLSDYWFCKSCGEQLYQQLEKQKKTAIPADKIHARDDLIEWSEQ